MNRLDKILVDRGLADSRTQAQKLIAAGAVKLDTHGLITVADKASAKYAEDISIAIDKIDELKYVSRAGLKLESAILEMQSRNLIPETPLDSVSGNKVILDIGQSTGGFTDFLIQTGASKVVGIDVGHDQLSKGLRGNPKVICYEGINARELPFDALLSHAPAGFDWVVMDVSFISQTLIIPNIEACLKSDGLLISLVKPQFEAGKDNVGKGGIVKSEAVFEQVKQRVCSCLENNGLTVLAYFKSGLIGADGNQEFFVIAKKLQA